MRKSAYRILSTFVAIVACLATCRPVAAQAPEPYAGAPNYPQNYQPAGNPPSANTSASNPAPASYPQQPNQPVGPPQYPTIEQRQPVVQPAYGPQPVAYGQDPRAQGQLMQGQANQGPSAGPTMQPAAPQPPQAPFVLSPQEAAVLDRVLTDWQKRNKEIRALESKFYRWKYDGVFGNGNQPPPMDEGELKFAAPDKGLFLLKGKQEEQSEQWVCDGRAIFQFDYAQKMVTEHVLPPELQGKAIADGPLPFVFCTDAQKLKQRYFMRIITPPNVPNEVWLEAYPRFQQQAAEFKKVEVILQIGGPAKGLLPYAIQIYSPNGKDRLVYQLQDPVINPQKILAILQGDWWKPSIPFTWKKRTELPPQPQPAQARVPGAATQR